MKFQYLRDPIFLTSVTLFALNPWLIKPLIYNSFVHSSLNDVLCIPVTVPIILALLKRFRLRDHDGMPTGPEVLIPLVMWSFIFEVWMPHWRFSPEKMVADPMDVLAYAAGAAAAWLIWNFEYGRKFPSVEPMTKSA